VNAAVLAGARPATEVLALRPLDGRLHGQLARKAANARDWDIARARALAATRLRPGDIDAWLLLAAAHAELGEPARADEAIARALDLLHAEPEPVLLAWLLERYPDPERLAALGPTREEPWRLLVDALAERAPRHADALAAARARARPDDPEPLRLRHALALHAHEPSLALHHARLWRQLAPDQVAAHLAVARALRAFTPPRLTEARDAVDTALVNQAFADLAERGLLEQELVDVLVALGDDASLARAKQLLPDLLGRPATRDDRRLREALAERIRTNAPDTEPPRR
jgi:hypothetical protein